MNIGMGGLEEERKEDRKEQRKRREGWKMNEERKNVREE